MKFLLREEPLSQQTWEFAASTSLIRWMSLIVHQFTRSWSNNQSPLQRQVLRLPLTQELLFQQLPIHYMEGITRIRPRTKISIFPLHCFPDSIWYSFYQTDMIKTWMNFQLNTSAWFIRTKRHPTTISTIPKSS